MEQAFVLLASWCFATITIWYVPERRFPIGSRGTGAGYAGACGARARRFLFHKPAVALVHLAGKLLINSHCIDEPTVPGALSCIRASGANDPVNYLRKFDDVPRLIRGFAVLATTERANAEIRIGRVASVVFDDIGIEHRLAHHDPSLQQQGWQLIVKVIHYDIA